jgi:hypothetical protein
VSPDPTAVDLHPTRFESAAPAGDSSLAVRYWSGVAPCSVLGRVDVEETATTVRVTLWVGRAASAGPGTACITLAAYYEVVVGLDAPLGDRTVVDGAA